MKKSNIKATALCMAAGLVLCEGAMPVYAAGTDVFTHMKHMLHTTLPSMILACIAYGNLSIHGKVRVVSIRHSRHLIVGYMYQRPYP